jgi:hypothetical protein
MYGMSSMNSNTLQLFLDELALLNREGRTLVLNSSDQLYPNPKSYKFFTLEEASLLLKLLLENPILNSTDPLKTSSEIQETLAHLKSFMYWFAINYDSLFRYKTVSQQMRSEICKDIISIIDKILPPRGEYYLFDRDNIRWAHEHLIFSKDVEIVDATLDVILSRLPDNHAGIWEVYKDNINALSYLYNINYSLSQHLIYRKYYITECYKKLGFRESEGESLPLDWVIKLCGLPIPLEPSGDEWYSPLYS